MELEWLIGHMCKLIHRLQQMANYRAVLPTTKWKMVLEPLKHTKWQIFVSKFEANNLIN